MKVHFLVIYYCITSQSPNLVASYDLFLSVMVLWVGLIQLSRSYSDSFMNFACHMDRSFVHAPFYSQVGFPRPQENQQLAVCMSHFGC